MLESFLIKPKILLNERLHHGCFLIKKFYHKSAFLTAEEVVRRCSIKKVFLEISQNLQDWIRGIQFNLQNSQTCATESFLIKLQASELRPATLLKKTLWHRCFPVNFAKFLWTRFFKELLWWLLCNRTSRGRCFWYLKNLIFNFLILNLWILTQL